MTPNNKEKMSKKPKSKSMDGKNAQSTPGGSNNTPNKAENKDKKY